MNVDELKATLDHVLPRNAFRDHGIHGGHATWTFPENIWELSYAAGSGGLVETIHLKAKQGTAIVSLNRDGVDSLLDILKAVGAVSG